MHSTTIKVSSLYVTILDSRGIYSYSNYVAHKIANTLTIITPKIPKRIEIFYIPITYKDKNANRVTNTYVV